ARYKEYAASAGAEADVFLTQKKILNSKSFKKAIESIIQNEKVNAAYAVMTTSNEITSTFRNLEEEVIKERIAGIRLLSDRLIG
ncbi:phosphoenolpyruvate-utilizing N-terminal domain-containing protein, partial [Acinetobacter baumannii]|nr:phosphoenolpyruvate-utilizing N-terminal domain-containing protein [Acinetobacter baumannii]